MVFLAKLRGSEVCVMQGKHLPNISVSARPISAGLTDGRSLSQFSGTDMGVNR